MQYDHFVGQVQHRARLASRGEAVAAIRATLETLSERLAGGEAKDLAAQLPKEIGICLRGVWDGQSQRFSLREFYVRVSVREGVALPKAIYHARAVIAVTQEAVSKGELDDIRSQLPVEFSSLFDLQEEMDSENMVASQSQTRERIQQRAYFKFVERGGAIGHELDDWSEAEREEIEKRAYDSYLQRGAGDGDPLTDWAEAERQVKEEEMSAV